MSLSANVRCSEPLVWFKAPATLSLLVLPRTPLGYPVVVALNLQDPCLQELQQFIDALDVWGWANSESLIWVWVVTGWSACQLS